MLSFSKKKKGEIGRERERKIVALRGAKPDTKETAPRRLDWLLFCTKERGERGITLVMKENKLIRIRTKEVGQRER